MPDFRVSKDLQCCRMRESKVQNLFLVDSASGTGKSDLLRYVSSYNADDVTYITKLTTRPRRPYEKSDAFLLDLEMSSEDECERVSRNTHTAMAATGMDSTAAS